MPVSRERVGEWFILATNILWAFFPILVFLSLGHMGHWTSLGWSTLLSAALFALIIQYRGLWGELSNWILWKYSFYIALSIGFFYYGLYFWGLTSTTPGNVSLIALFEVFTTYAFFNIWRGEKIRGEYAAGGLLMLVGAVIVLLPNVSEIHAGDFLILAATFATPVGNYFQQKARLIASSESVLFLRSIFSGIAACAVAYVLGERASMQDIWISLPYLALNGLILLGFSKILFIEGIHRISVTKAIALGSITPALTLLLAWVILRQEPTLFQLSALVPLMIGTLLLTDQIKLRAGCHLHLWR